jgi:APA family basic amino acid/polyamine antiporter
VSPSSDSGLVRALGVRSLTASIVNMTIGAGIFVLPAAVAAGLGAAAPVAYLVCAALMALIVSCFAAAASRVSLTGGLYAYVEVAYGPFVGFLSGVLYALTAAFAVASVASAFAGSVAAIWAPAASPSGRALLLTGLLAILAAINVRGVTFGARLVEAMTAAKLLPLVILIGAGAWAVNPEFVRWPGMPAPSVLGRTCVLLIFAFAGVEIALVPSGEVRAPARTVPRALFLALAVTTTIYLLIQRVAQGLLGASIAQFASAPLAEAASRVIGGSGRLLVVGGAIVSMFGYVAGDMLGSPRSLYAFARDGTLPEALARIHPRYHTPYLAIVTYAAIIAALAISGSFTQLAILANVAALSLYLMGVAASFELQRRDVRDARAGREPFDLPLGPAIPVAAATAIVWMLTNATSREFYVEALVVAVASLFYFIRK